MSDNLHRGFLLGLIAGEGSFYVTMANDQRRKYDVCPGIRFSVTMGFYEQEMLEALQEATGLGSVTTHGKGFQWTISSRKDCHELNGMIDGWLDETDTALFRRSHKYTAYQKWKEILEDFFQPGKTLGKNDLIEVAQLKEDINCTPGGAARSAEELKDIIER